MLYFSSIISVLEVLLLTVPVLLTVAYVTVAERKTMASMQRRLGPNIVGYYGLLQAFADALKLLLKEYVSPTQANLILFFLGPIITLVFSLLGYGVIPYAPGLSLSDFNLGILYVLAMSSLATYGILLAGWSANSKYAFLGSLRSTAQLISYELILSSAILLVILLTGSLNLTVIIEAQKNIWFIFPLFPIFLIFFIGSIAETNRAPFDLAEAESELVSGFMTEHAAVIFVFFFLAEYASIVLICILTSILFLGGYLINIKPLLYIYLFLDIISIYFINILDYYISTISGYLGGNVNNFTFPSISILDLFNGSLLESFIYGNKSLTINPIIEGVLCGFILGFKSCIMIFVFIWARASFPRIRFDQLMTFCWTILLPLVIAFIILIPCILYNFDIFSWNNTLL
jgi:NADH-ubiquinone oxidoreductase chain 1